MRNRWEIQSLDDDLSLDTHDTPPLSGRSSLRPPYLSRSSSPPGRPAPADSRQSGGPAVGRSSRLRPGRVGSGRVFLADVVVYSGSMAIVDTRAY